MSAKQPGLLVNRFSSLNSLISLGLVSVRTSSISVFLPLYFSRVPPRTSTSKLQWASLHRPRRHSFNGKLYFILALLHYNCNLPSIHQMAHVFRVQKIAPSLLLPPARRVRRFTFFPVCAGERTCYRVTSGFWFSIAS